ncbi:MAG TPA: hydrogenase maturation nickel metallochaperone HypA [Methanomassiliicoccales archaeon]|nr:hydrogenase maturation nickel metallochaperone HypA [Methanomassiliicoccales archaeon]
MHEVSVMTSILESVKAELVKHSYDKVEELVLVVGELTYLGKDQLEFAYEILTRGSDLEGSKLVIEEEKVEVECPKCFYRGAADYLIDGTYHNAVPKLNCPKCGGPVNVLKGKSCRISSVKVVES